MILIIGGLGNNQDYFKSLCRELLKHSLHEQDAVMIKTFSNDDMTVDNITNLFIDVCKSCTNIKVVAFSMSCFPVLDSVSQLTIDNQTYITRLILVDPANVFHELNFNGIKNPKNVCSSYQPLAPLLRRTNGFVGNLFKGWFDWILHFTKASSIVRCFVCYIIGLTSEEAGKAPTSVNDMILKMSASDLKRLIGRCLLSYNPYNIKLNNRIIHVVTGSTSVYRQYCELLASVRANIKLHVILDANHHMLYYNPKASANKILSII